MPEELLHQELSESIIGAAMTVLNQLKPGLDEKLYENAMVIDYANGDIKSNNKSHFPSIMKTN